MQIELFEVIITWPLLGHFVFERDVRIYIKGDVFVFLPIQMEMVEIIPEQNNTDDKATTEHICMHHQSE
jgi:hypothetical protein